VVEPKKIKGRASSNEKMNVYRLLGIGCRCTILAPRASVAGSVGLLFFFLRPVTDVDVHIHECTLTLPL